jgi:hypothetical protein
MRHANAGGLDIDVRFVRHEDGGLKGEHAALFDIAQTGQVVAVGADEGHGDGLDPVQRLLFSHRSRYENSSFRAGARGLSNAISLRRPVMTYCVSTMLVV